MALQSGTCCCLDPSTDKCDEHEKDPLCKLTHNKVMSKVMKIEFTTLLATINELRMVLLESDAKCLEFLAAGAVECSSNKHNSLSFRDRAHICEMLSFLYEEQDANELEYDLKENGCRYKKKEKLALKQKQNEGEDDNGQLGKPLYP